MLVQISTVFLFLSLSMLSAISVLTLPTMLHNRKKNYINPCISRQSMNQNLHQSMLFTTAVHSIFLVIETRTIFKTIIETQKNNIPSMNKYMLFLSTLTSCILSFHFSYLFLQILPTIHLPKDHSNSAPSHHAILISFPTNTSFAFMRNAVINMVKPTALVLVLTGMQLVRLHNQTVDRGRTSDQLRLLHPRKLLKAFVLPITPSLRSLTQLSVYPKYFRAR